MPDSTDTNEEEIELIAQTPIRHDGKDVAEGELFTVKNERQAVALTGCGAACHPEDIDADDDAESEAKAKEEAANDPEKRKAAIIEAIALLEPGNKEQFTNDGKPDARELSDLLGWTVSAQERDAIWEEVNPADNNNGGNE